MNIIEAINSGRPFRRINRTDDLWLAPIDPKKDMCMYFMLNDILADDWEIQQDPVTITREQFENAWREVVGFNEPYSALVCDAVAKELGL